VELSDPEDDGTIDVDVGGTEADEEDDDVSAKCLVFRCECRSTHEHKPECWVECSEGEQCLVVRRVCVVNNLHYI
jgi:hypothetical protein